jgi:SAM-dependent methyltransferase
MTAAAPPSRLRQTFDNVAFSAHGDTWSSLYKDGFHPWDREGPSLALADLLAQRTDLVPLAQDHDQRGNPVRDESGSVVRRTALVPGCGRGHDVLLLSSFGYDVVGLDYSPDAVRMAQENQAAAEKNGLYKPVEGLERGQVKWLVGDFFSQDVLAGLGTGGSGTFDLIYDYTVCTPCLISWCV